ncbi:MAG: GntR family transcriptional regulator [Bacteroidaceae bacterium]|nr:GntR family transcriptional regulator [Bacteroidaceae bacterium]
MDKIRLGRTHVLRVIRQVDFGYYLDGGEVYGDILLPNGEVADDATVLVDDDVEVFLYLDQEERLVATMRQPLAQVGDFAYLEVAWVNNYGAFLDWGLQKDLFVPFREQKMKMQKGQRYIVHVHLDPESYRIMASAKVERYLSDEWPRYRMGDRVEALIWQKTDMGLKAIVDNQFGGLLYDNQLFRDVRTGDRLTAYVRQVREDGKIDLMLQPMGQDAVHDFSDTLLDYIRKAGGHINLCDKTPADEIYALFGVSKKVFKKALGDLYRQHLIIILPDGVSLVES